MSVKNKKGFTMLELIAVISIIAILLVIMIPTITNISNDSKESLRKSKINTIEIAGTKFTDDNINDYHTCVGNTPNKNECTIKLEELVANAYLESEESITDPNTNELFKGELLVCYNASTVEVKTHFIKEGDPYICS